MNTNRTFRLMMNGLLAAAALTLGPSLCQAQNFAAPMPDLTVQTVYEFDTGAWVQVKNIGSATSAPCKLSSAYLIGWAWYSLGYQQVGALAPGASYWVQVNTGDIDADFYSYKIDVFEHVAESNEKNNLKYLPYNPF